MPECERCQQNDPYPEVVVKAKWYDSTGTLREEFICLNCLDELGGRS